MLCSLLALAGVGTFVSSLVALHVVSSGIDLIEGYVSNLANGPFGWLFFTGAFVHGWGNLALGLGLGGTLHTGPLRTWAVLLFSLAAVGIMLTALFPTDLPGNLPTMTGLVHRSVASAAFAFELAAVFVFSLAFGRQSRWRRQQTVSLVLSASAAVAMMMFVIAIQVGVAPGLAERTALAVLLVWELWVIYHLIRAVYSR